jgi:fatty aldehyde-generating acyl-ACP reductase
MPFIRNASPAFVFLVHPRDVKDLYNVRGSSVVADHSADESEFRDKMLSLPPTITGEITFGFDPIRGEMLVVLCLPEQIMFSRGRDEIDRALEVVESRGALVLGLGALTAPATRGGLTLVPKLPRRLTLTTGNAFTAAVARRNVVEASEFLGLDDRATVAVVGCTGSVGVAAARLLDRAGFRLILIGRSQTRVRKELADLVPHATVSGSLDDLAHADITLLLTGDPSAQVTPGIVKPGSVILDLAHPVNIQREDYQAFAQRDIHVAQGGLVNIPGYHLTTDLRLADRHSALACLAETYLFAKEGITEHSVGQASPDLAIELEAVAVRHRVQVRPLDLPATHSVEGAEPVR